MYAVEFETEIRNGMIRVPDRYRVNGQVRVILLASESHKDEQPDLIAELLKNPVSVPNFVPLSRDEAHERS